MRPKMDRYLEINMRSDTYTRWHKFNPILKEGEMACVVLGKRVKLFKVGDGVTEFKKLKYVSLEEALERGYIFGTFKDKETGRVLMNTPPVCINLTTDKVYDDLCEIDYQIESNI